MDADLLAILVRLRTGTSSDPRADSDLVQQEVETLRATLEDSQQEGEKLRAWSKMLAQKGVAQLVQVCVQENVCF